MKTRNGFVTNSSSSSFVIAVKKDIEEGPMKIFIDNMFDKDYSTEKEYEEYILWNYGYESVEELKEEDCIYEKYIKCIEAIKEGYFIAYEFIDYDAVEQFNTMVAALEKAGVAKLMERD